MSGDPKPGQRARAFAQQAGEALRQAVAEVFERNRKQGTSMPIARDGQVVLVDPNADDGCESKDKPRPPADDSEAKPQK